MPDTYADLNVVLDRLCAKHFHEDERESRAPLLRVMCQEFIARCVRDDAYVLDLDSGYCAFINNISARRRIAVDLSSDAVRFAAPRVERHRP